MAIAYDMDSARELKKALARALGLDPSNVRRVVIDISPKSLITAYVEQGLTKPQLEAVTALMESGVKADVVHVVLAGRDNAEFVGTVLPGKIA